MVSSMTREMVREAALSYEDRGTYELKGMNGVPQLFAARIARDPS